MPEQWNKYGPTAARKQWQARDASCRPKSTTIDIHSHVAIPAPGAFVKPHLDPATIPLTHFADATTKALNQKQEEDIRARITSYDERLADMDAMGIDMQLVLPAPNQCTYTVPLDIAVQAARMVHDGLSQYVAKRPDQFVALGTVPLSDGAEAAKELERCMMSLGMKGAEILTNVAGRELSEPQFAPFWKKAEELGALVVIHPNGFTDAKRLARFLFQQRHRQSAGDHHRAALSHFRRRTRAPSQAENSGGARRRLSASLFRPHRSCLGGALGLHADLPQPPTSYLKKVYFDTVVFTPHQLAQLVRQFGIDQIVMGTDYPFDMAEFDPIGHVASVEGFDRSTIAAITGGNARRRLGL